MWPLFPTQTCSANLWESESHNSCRIGGEDLLRLNAPWYLQQLGCYYSNDDKPVRLHKYMQLALSLYLGIITQNKTSPSSCFEAYWKAWPVDLTLKAVEVDAKAEELGKV